MSLDLLQQKDLSNGRFLLGMDSFDYPKHTFVSIKTLLELRFFVLGELGRNPLRHLYHEH